MYHYTKFGMALAAGGVSSASMVVLLMRCRLRLPSRIVSTGSMPVLIQRMTVA